MTEPTTADKLKLERCPKCEMQRLKCTMIGASKRHECISCGYLMIWKPSTWRPDGDRIPT